MQIRVRASGYLQQKMPGRKAEQELQLPVGWTVRDLIEELGLPASQVWVIRVNGEHVNPTYTLRNGDYAELFPLVGGG
ncbi:MAG: MoaD/ThiS family protein [Anaerolineae bacterium]